MGLGILVIDNVDNKKDYYCPLRTNFFLSSNLLLKVFLRIFFFSLPCMCLVEYLLERAGFIIVLILKQSLKFVDV